MLAATTCGGWSSKSMWLTRTRAPWSESDVEVTRVLHDLSCLLARSVVVASLVSCHGLLRGMERQTLGVRAQLDGRRRMLDSLRTKAGCHADVSGACVQVSSDGCRPRRVPSGARASTAPRPV